MYVCMPQTYIHTYIHTYSLFARRINIDFNRRVLGRIENPKRASTTMYTFIKLSTVKYLQEHEFFQSLEYNKSGTAITDDVCVNTRLALSHNSLWISQARLRSCAGRYLMWQRLDMSACSLHSLQLFTRRAQAKRLVYKFCFWACITSNCFNDARTPNMGFADNVHSRSVPFIATATMWRTRWGWNVWNAWCIRRC